MQFEIFYNLLIALQTVTNTYTQLVREQSCANHVQHIGHSSYAMCHVVRRDSSPVKFDWMHSRMKEADHLDNNNNRIQRRYSRFFTISSQCRKLSPTRTLKWPGRNRVQITCNTSSACHLQVSCYVPLGTKGQLSC